MTKVHEFKKINYFLTLANGTWLAIGEKTVKIPGIPVQKFINGKWRKAPSENASQIIFNTYFSISSDGKMTEINYDTNANVGGRAKPIKSITGEIGIIYDNKIIWSEKPNLIFDLSKKESFHIFINKSKIRTLVIPVHRCKDVCENIEIFENRQYHSSQYVYNYVNFINPKICEILKNITKGSDKHDILIINLDNLSDYRVMKMPFVVSKIILNASGNMALIIGSKKYCIIDIDQ